MDKQKEIEEMKDIVHNLWDKLNQDAITTNDIIDALYNAGYRKIDKDSVVLTMEELKKLETNYKIGLGKSQSWCKSLKNQIEELKNENFKLQQQLDNKIKETAEKSINDIFKICKQRFNDTKGYTCWGDIEIAIQQYAEQVGVEIKE